MSCSACLCETRIVHHSYDITFEHSSCQKNKSWSEYYLRRDNTATLTYCKDCTNEQTTERTRKLKLEAVRYKGGFCEGCGYSRCLAAMEFHHRDPASKDFTISERRKASLDELKPELDKCALLCCRCHREVESGVRECP